MCDVCSVQADEKIDLDLGEGDGKKLESTSLSDVM